MQCNNVGTGPWGNSCAAVIIVSYSNTSTLLPEPEYFVPTGSVYLHYSRALTIYILTFDRVLIPEEHCLPSLPFSDWKARDDWHLCKHRAALCQRTSSYCHCSFTIQYARSFFASQANQCYTVKVTYKTCSFQVLPLYFVMNNYI